MNYTLWGGVAAFVLFSIAAVLPHQAATVSAEGSRSTSTTSAEVLVTATIPPQQEVLMNESDQIVTVISNTDHQGEAVYIRQGTNQLLSDCTVCKAAYAALLPQLDLTRSGIIYTRPSR